MRRAGAMLQHSALCDAAFHVDRYPNASEAHVEARLTREEEKRIGPNAGRPRWRDVDATGSHLRAVLHAARAGRAADRLGRIPRKSTCLSVPAGMHWLGLGAYRAQMLAKVART